MAPHCVIYRLILSHPFNNAGCSFVPEGSITQRNMSKPCARTYAWVVESLIVDNDQLYPIGSNE
jgi:hypothetical protein